VTLINLHTKGTGNHRHLKCGHDLRWPGMKNGTVLIEFSGNTKYPILPLKCPLEE